MDNLDDKLINVIVKYTVQGQDTAQTSSKKTKDTFMRDMDEMLSAFQKLRSEGIRTWEDLAKNMDKLDLSKVSDEFKQPFLEAAQTLANYESLYEQANPGKSGGPLDPQAPRKYGQELQTVEQGLQRLKSTGAAKGSRMHLPTPQMPNRSFAFSATPQKPPRRLLHPVARRSNKKAPAARATGALCSPLPADYQPPASVISTV